MWNIVCIIPLSIMIVSDLRWRHVNVWILLLFGACIAVASVIGHGMRMAICNCLGNSAVCLMFGISLYMYSKLRHVSYGSMVGLGDMIFVLMLTPYFDFYGYAVFLVSASCLSLALWICFRRKWKDIPLVSTYG
ncbi:MAG: hypothetical protein NC308_11565, partial [Clostridium sp.]|nr:hypothetical protein [Clostridium sp.]